MEIHAYDRDYLNDAQDCLGVAFDYGMLTLGYQPNEISAFLVNSDVARQFEHGNPKYVSGMNGCELMKLILSQCGIERKEPDAIYIDKSPEYWAGWSLAFYQWYSVRTFQEILTAVPLKKILEMYDTFHEMDLMQFADAMDENIRNSRKDGNLARIRKNQKMTLKELSGQTGIPAEEIRELESGCADINQASGNVLFRLSRALSCSMEDLLEKGKRLRRL